MPNAPAAAEVGCKGRDFASHSPGDKAREQKKNSLRYFLAYEKHLGGERQVNSLLR